MMKLQQDKTRAESTNKVVLDEEKEKYSAEVTVEKLKRQLQPKRTRTHDDTHEMVVEVDNWDLSVYRLDSTRVQNRLNV
jgi:hypothetical protein